VKNLERWRFILKGVKSGPQKKKKENDTKKLKEKGKSGRGGKNMGVTRIGTKWRVLEKKKDYKFTNRKAGSKKIARDPGSEKNEKSDCRFTKQD